MLRGRKAKKLFIVLGVAACGLIPLSVSAGAQTDDTGPEGLESAVLSEMGRETQTYARTFAEKEREGETQVNVMKESRDGSWAMGSAVIEAPKKEGYYPEGWLFVANVEGNGWNVEFEGTPAFAELSDEAPQTVVSEDEAEVFEAQSRAASSKAAKKVKNTKLALPWKKGKTWKFTGGPHGWETGFDTPYSSLDFAGAGSDQKVRASGGGRVYNMCSTKRGWIRVYHPNGFTTDYYHLVQNIRPASGARIKGGSFLGYTGEDVSCGGAAFGRHVHFSLMRGETRVGFNKKRMGGWVFHNGSEAYAGHATRGSVRKNAGSTIKNYGAAG